MVELFLKGEPLFMFVLLLLLTLIVLVYGLGGSGQWLGQRLTKSGRSSRLFIRELGLMAAVFGMFSQFLGLYGALESIRVWGEVTWPLLRSGIGVSFIPCLFGWGIGLFALGLSQTPRMKVKPA